MGLGVLAEDNFFMPHVCVLVTQPKAGWQHDPPAVSCASCQQCPTTGVVWTFVRVNHDVLVSHVVLVSHDRGLCHVCPSFLQVMQGRPTGVVAACKDINLGREIQELFASPNMRVNTTTDVTGAHQVLAAWLAVGVLCVMAHTSKL